MSDDVLAAYLRAGGTLPDRSKPKKNRKKPMRDSTFRQAGGRPPNEASAAVDRINDRHALVLTGGSAAILREEADGLFSFLGVDAFHTWHSNLFVTVDRKAITESKVWMTSRRRRQYEGIVFDPSGTPPGYYNLWRGFSVKPRAGDCSLFLDHVRDNICRGDPVLYRWVMGWFAQIFQHPNHKPGVALVLRGLKGTGKSIVADIIGSLLGWHHVLVNSAEKITGKFNGHQARCLLLQADEAVWAGDHQAESVLKGLITNTKHLVEHKGKDPIEMPNFMRVFMSANADWVVPASFDERRYAVLDVGDARRGDHAYFGAIMKQMDSGGREALLHHLLHFDLSDLNIGVAPQTDALAEQKLRSMSPEVAFWHQCLIDGEIFAGTGWPVLIERKALYNRYLDHVAKRNIRRPLTENEFGIELRRLVNNKKLKTEIGSSQPRSAGRRWHHELPTLELCRDAFDDLAGFVTGWGSIDTDLSVPSNALT